MVSKSFAPAGHARLAAGDRICRSGLRHPASAAMVAFGALSATNGRLVVYGWLDDTSNTANPQVLGKQYNEAASEDMARTIAHRFADEIIARLGGGINGIAETKILFRQFPHRLKGSLGDGLRRRKISTQSRTSAAFRSRRASRRTTPALAFASLGREGWSVRMYSLELGRLVAFPCRHSGRRQPVAGLVRGWSQDRILIVAFGRSGDMGCRCQRRQPAQGSHISKDPTFRPTWNPRTNAQIAWVSGRTGLPQIYIMDQDGANVQRMTDGGYAVSPSWSSNGQFLTFSWNRKYGPGAPGGQDIYIMDIATKRWQQLTHDAGSNDFPSWSPDGRHIVFEREAGEPHGDLDDARRRHRSAPANAFGKQLYAELELEVKAGTENTHCARSFIFREDRSSADWPWGSHNL